ncbi:MAG TPA: single-stranded DNA-binding protein [Ruminococcaceae bacterium]|nr:single-stranded DNA-binding protein [Oscillospiraceae bacterium]
MLNLVALMGRCTVTPELKQAKDGISFSRFGIAVERNYKADGKEKETDFLDIICWRHEADFAAKYFQKGQLIAVKGEIHTRTYEDTNGKKHKVVEISADEMYSAEHRRSD